MKEVISVLLPPSENCLQTVQTNMYNARVQYTNLLCIAFNFVRETVAESFSIISMFRLINPRQIWRAWVLHVCDARSTYRH
jgi:hypothetical protein